MSNDENSDPQSSTLNNYGDENKENAKTAKPTDSISKVSKPYKNILDLYLILKNKFIIVFNNN